MGVLLAAGGNLSRQLGGQLVGQRGELVQDADDLALHLDGRDGDFEMRVFTDPVPLMVERRE